MPLTCTLGTVPAHSRATITVIAIPLETGTLVNHAHVTTTSVNTAAASSLVIASAKTKVLRVPLTLGRRWRRCGRSWRETGSTT